MFTGVQFTNSLLSLTHHSVLHNTSLLPLVPISQAAVCMCPVATDVSAASCKTLEFGAKTEQFAAKKSLGKYYSFERRLRRRVMDGDLGLISLPIQV